MAEPHQPKNSSVKTKPVPHYTGHRERLRTRFLVDNGKSMPDYELLELLLMTAIPRRDVKPLSKKLLEEYGSFASVINAPQRLLLASGLTLNTIAVFKIVVASALKMSWQELSGKDKVVLSNFDYMLDYCRTAMSHLEVEEFRVIFLNSRLQIIKEEVMQRGTVNNVAVHPREVVKAALEHGAISVVLFHNHPGGKAQPSGDDRVVTEQIVQALRPLKIKVYDHIIVTRDNYYSFRENGLIMDVKV